MILKLKRTPGIYLVGFMCSGKTTVGKLLADELGWFFGDVDEDIESEQGTTIAQIFDTRGEEAFRELETAAIRKRIHSVVRGHPTVVALGGGAFTRTVNYELLEEHGITIWLDCPFDVLRQRVGPGAERPLARDVAKMERLYDERKAAYARADYRVDASGDASSAVKAILELPIF